MWRWCAPSSVGLGLTAYINVRIEKHTGGDKRSPMDVFAAAVQTWPEVVECVSLTGEMDYLLRIVVADMDHYTRFVMDTLLKHPERAGLQDELRDAPGQGDGDAGLTR